MPCDEGRVRGILRWCLIDGHGDDDFRQKQRNAQAGIATGSEAILLSGCVAMLENHDYGAVVALRECQGNLVRWGREIMGITSN